MASEGYRPRPSGLYPCSSVDSRRYRICSQAPGLQLHLEQEDPPSGSEVCAERKAAEANIVVIDEIKMDAPKTKEFAAFLNAVGVQGKALVVTAEASQNVVKSGRNIPGCEVTFANLINVYDIVNANKLVVDKAALQKIEEVFA